MNIQKAIENGPVEIVDFPIKHGGSFHCYVKLPEGITFPSRWASHGDFLMG